MAALGSEVTFDCLDGQRSSIKVAGFFLSAAEETGRSLVIVPADSIEGGIEVQIAASDGTLVECRVVSVETNNLTLVGAETAQKRFAPLAVPCRTQMATWYFDNKMGQGTPAISSESEPAPAQKVDRVDGNRLDALEKNQAAMMKSLADLTRAAEAIAKAQLPG